MLASHTGLPVLIAGLRALLFHQYSPFIYITECSAAFGECGPVEGIRTHTVLVLSQSPPANWATTGYGLRDGIRTHTGWIFVLLYVTIALKLWRPCTYKVL